MIPKAEGPSTALSGATLPNHATSTPADTLKTDALAKPRLTAPSTTESNPPKALSPYRFVFQDAKMKIEFTKFLKTIFYRLNTVKLFKLMDEILADPNKTDAQIYKELYQRIGEAQKTAAPLHALKSLAVLKKEMATQAASLMEGEKKDIDGYVEIGFPGGRFVRPLKSALTIHGNVTVVNTQESFADRVQGGFPFTRPYHKFVPMGDQVGEQTVRKREYAPIKETAIPSSSVDLVSCLVGLHHIRPENSAADSVHTEDLDAFVQSMARILRPGGSLLLRDHDVKTVEQKAFVSVVHSIFNAATGATPEEEAAENRDFQSLDYWSAVMERNGFVRVHSPTPTNISQGLIIDQDPTDNAMVRFERKPTTREEVIASLKYKADYERPLFRTYLTTPEWQNVEASTDYASFLANNQPAYKFGYFSQIRLFWQVFCASCKAARNEAGLSLWDVATNEHTMMSLFIGTWMTIEFAAKGIAVAPLRWIYGSRDAATYMNTEEWRHFAGVANDYAKFIQHTPFYQFDYFGKIGPYWQKFMATFADSRTNHGLWHALMSERTIMNLINGLLWTLELIGKELISIPVKWMCGSGSNKESDTTHILIEDRNNQIENLDPQKRVKIKRSYGIDGLKLIEVPRYKPCTEILGKIAENKQITCLQICGQEDIQLKVRIDAEKTFPSLYAWNILPTPDQKYLAVKVKVKDLAIAIPDIKAHGGEIIFAHDF